MTPWSSRNTTLRTWSGPEGSSHSTGRMCADVAEELSPNSHNSVLPHLAIFRAAQLSCLI